MNKIQCSPYPFLAIKRNPSIKVKTIHSIFENSHLYLNHAVIVVQTNGISKNSFNMTSNSFKSENYFWKKIYCPFVIVPKHNWISLHQRNLMTWTNAFLITAFHCTACIVRSVIKSIDIYQMEGLQIQTV